jgi:hypothetical protein
MFEDGENGQKKGRGMGLGADSVGIVLKAGDWRIARLSFSVVCSLQILMISQFDLTQNLSNSEHSN